MQSISNTNRIAKTFALWRLLFAVLLFFLEFLSFSFCLLDQRQRKYFLHFLQHPDFHRAITLLNCDEISRLLYTFYHNNLLEEALELIAPYINDMKGLGYAIKDCLPDDEHDDDDVMADGKIAVAFAKRFEMELRFDLGRHPLASLSPNWLALINNHHFRRERDQRSSGQQSCNCELQTLESQSSVYKASIRVNIYSDEVWWHNGSIDQVRRTEILALILSDDKQIKTLQCCKREEMDCVFRFLRDRQKDLVATKLIFETVLRLKTLGHTVPQISFPRGFDIEPENIRTLVCESTRDLAHIDSLLAKNASRVIIELQRACLQSIDQALPLYVVLEILGWTNALITVGFDETKLVACIARATAIAHAYPSRYIPEPVDKTKKQRR